MKRVKAAAALLMTGVMLMTSGCVHKIIDLATGGNKEYDSIVEKWQDGNTFEGEAADDAIGALFSAAAAKDHDEFKECFTEKLQSKAGFDGKVDAFIKAFPKELADAELTYSGGGAGGSFDDDNVERGATYSYECTVNGEWYHVNVSFCYCNDKHPEKVGVERIFVTNLNAQAYHNDKASWDYNYYDKFDILCDIKSDAEMPARLIAGSAYLWNETDTPKLSEDQMRDLLNEYGDLGNREVREILGDANVIYKHSQGADYTLIYELKPVNGEPRYARIDCQTEYGKIYDAYVCTTTDTDYKNPLYEFN